MAANGIARYIISWCLILFLKRTVSITKDVLQEVCLGEDFHADCPDNQVVIMLSALFGRMHAGRCARQFDIGCVADVLEYIDSKCSGNERCDLSTLDRGLYALNTCPADFPPYLEAVYSCISVISDPAVLSQCQQTGVIVLSGIAKGNIASSIVQNSRHGSTLCPWVIEAEQGQHINITLVDFRIVDTVESAATCHIYATINEHSSPSPTTLCSGTEREQVVYLSSSSRLEIQFAEAPATESTSRFLLRFSAVGCGDPPLYGNIIKEITFRKAVLYCKSTGKEQQIFCKGTSWNESVHRCDEYDWKLSDWGSQKGIWIVLVIGIAIGVVIGLGLLLCGVMCFRRFKGRTNTQTNEPPYFQHTEIETNKSFSTLRKGDTSHGEMDYATYDRTASGPQHYMRVTGPVNRDVILVESGSIRRHGAIPPMGYGQSPIRYVDQEEPAYGKPSS